MRLLAVLCLLALLSPACGPQAEPTADSSPTPAAQSPSLPPEMAEARKQPGSDAPATDDEAPTAAEAPARAEEPALAEAPTAAEAPAAPTGGKPVAAGPGRKRFAETGYSVEFPATLHFENSPEMLGKVKQEVSQEIQAQGDWGQRFFLFYNEPGTGSPFNPNMNLVIEQVPEAAGEVSQEAYLKANEDNLAGALPGGRIVEEMKTVTLHGQTFGTLTYEFEMQGFPLRGKAYIHYDPERRAGYTLTMVDVKENWKKTFPTFEKVAKSFRVQ